MPFRTALSGLNASSAELRVIGNNIANASTTGFKKARIQFADIFASSNLGASSNAIGSGVRIGSIAQQFAQGNVEFTDNNLDLAISGQGFFRLNDSGISLYSRAGTFGADRSGYIVNSQDQRLTGFLADAAGNITGALGDIQLNTAVIAPQATTTVDYGLNLDASGAVPVAPVPSTTLSVAVASTFDDAQAVGVGPVSSGNFHTSMTIGSVRDTGGSATHTATVYFLKTAEGAGVSTDTWQARLYIDGNPAETTPHTLVFNEATGALQSIDGTNGRTTMAHGTYTFADGTTVSLTTDVATNLTLAAANSLAMTVDAGSVQGAFDPTNASSYNHSTSLTIFDSLGTNHLATMYYRKTGIPNQWEAYLYIDGNSVGAAADVLEFSSAGALSTINGAPTPPTTLTSASYNPANGASNMTLVMDYANVSQFGGGFNVNALVQDGYSTGRLSGIDIDDTGVILARFTNGQSRTLAQIALANFSNPQGLTQLGDTSWSESFESGAPLIGAPGSSSIGLIESGALEGSNVDLTEQLVSMITAQRNFQANAQVIQTADAVTQAIINIR